MKRIKLSKNGPEVSAVCFGTAGFGGAKMDEKTAFRLLDAFRDLGGNFADTANVYGRWFDGTNLGERIIGRWLASRGKSAMLIGTKCCHWSPERPGTPRVDEKSARADLEESLSALGLDMADICWLHRDDPQKPVAEIVGFCEKLRTEGLIRYYGFSNWSVDRLREAAEFSKIHGYGGLIGVQNGHAAPVISEKAAAAGDGTLRCFVPEQGDFHRKTGIAEIPYSAVGNGAFCIMEKAGVRVRNGKICGDFDGNIISSDFESRWFSERNLRRYEIMCGFVRESGCTMLDACVAFHTSRDYTDVPVIATSRAERLSEIAAASEKKLPPEIISEIEAV